MILFYFSGTGNSRFVAQAFCRAAGAQCYSIEEKLDASALVQAHEIVGFCYPIYGSCVARPMREFVLAHTEALAGKRFVVLCTQLMFSGDGAHALSALLPGGEKSVVYAEHFNMPNNLCNFHMFRVTNGRENAARLKRAEKRAARAAEEIAAGRIHRRGFHPVSIALGKSQSAFWPAIEERAKDDILVDADCIRCGLCARICPVGNLSMGTDGVEQAGKCVVCYRCVNACPKQAITTLIHTKPTRQYKGTGENDCL